MNTLETCNKIVLPTWWQKKIEYAGTVSYGMNHFAGNDHSQFYIKLEVKTRKNEKGRWGKPFRQHNSTIAQQQPELAELVRFDGWTQEGLFPSYLEAGISFYQSYTDEARYFRHLTLLEEAEDIPTRIRHRRHQRTDELARSTKTVNQRAVSCHYVKIQCRIHQRNHCGNRTARILRQINRAKEKCND